ncbi:MAG: hypothetical protein ABIH37_03845 [archaeon]
MKIPPLIISYTSGFIFFILALSLWSFKFHWAVVFGILFGVVVNLVETVFRGQD